MNQDPLTRKILKLIKSSKGQPMGRREIMNKTGASEMQARLRLADLRAEGLILGKKIEAGKGVWVYWNVEYIRAVAEWLKNELMSQGYNKKSWLLEMTPALMKQLVDEAFDKK